MSAGPHPITPCCFCGKPDYSGADASSDAVESNLGNQADQIRQEGENQAEATREAGEHADENSH